MHYKTPLDFMEHCVEYINTLPPSARLPWAYWLLSQVKTGPVGRRMINQMKQEYFLQCLRLRLS